MTDWNLAEFVTDQLTQAYGYELLAGEESVLFRRVVDAQHAVLFDALLDSGSASLTAGIARRDINELRFGLVGLADTDAFLRGPWAALADPGSTDQFLDMPLSVWHRPRDSEEEISEWFRIWIPQLETAANLAYVQESLEYEDPSWPEHRRLRARKRTLLARTANQMLWGWRGDRDFEEFLAPLQREIADHPGDAFEISMRERIDRTEAWILNHPQGIERELIGEARPLP
jgi:hypothetical protein